MSRFSHSLIPLSLMCYAPHSASAQWRSAGLRKSESSWHILWLTKDADLDYDPKMHLWALHLRRAFVWSSFPPAPKGTDNHNVCHRGLGTAPQHPPGAMQPWPTVLKRKAQRSGEKSSFLPIFGLCQRVSAPQKEGHLEAWYVPTEGTVDLMVSPHYQQALPLQK